MRFGSRSTRRQSPRYLQELHDLERAYWRRLLLEHGGNATAVARAVQINRTHLYARLKRLGIRNPIDRPSARRGNWGDLLAA